MRVIVMLAAAAFSAAPWSAAAQPTPPAAAAGSIAGSLTSADQGRPVRRATVKVTRSQPTATTRTAMTDAEGRFFIDGLPPGEYRLTASKPGFLESVFGARRPGAGVAGTPIRVIAGERTSGIAMRVPRGGVISGIVTDEFGDAAMGVPVRAMRIGYSNGARMASAVANATTDDLGGYRLAGLPPGEYVVSAIPRDSVAALASTEESLRARQAAIAAAGSRVALPGPDRSDAADGRGYVPVYFGGTVSASAAARVTVGLGEQISAIDIPLQAVKTATVRGTIANPDGTPAASANIQIIDQAMPVASIGVWFRNSTPGGRFSFAGLGPGTYVLNAQASGGSAGALSAVLTIPVSDDDVDVSVTLRRGVTVSGSIDLAPLKPAIDPRRVRVTLDPVPSALDWELQRHEAAPDAEGRFAIHNVPPAKYRVFVTGLPAGWSLDTAMFGDHEAADLHLQVGASDAAGRRHAHDHQPRGRDQRSAGLRREHAGRGSHGRHLPLRSRALGPAVAPDPRAATGVGRPL